MLRGYKKRVAEPASESGRYKVSGLNDLGGAKG